MKKRNLKGFTLVELLIVIALIAILSVAVLATLNPIEQANKGRDAGVQNDAAEVLSAYERYFVSKNSYPWLDVATTTMTTDSAYYSHSNKVAFGLCGTNAATPATQDDCTSKTLSGALVKSDELKSSFLSKSYTALTTDTGYSFMNELYLIKESNTNGNTISVCYIPKAKVNRNGKLKVLTVATDGLSATLADASDANKAAATYADLSTSLLKCIPE